MSAASDGMRMPPGAPPPGTLHKRPSVASAYRRTVERARQPTGGWKVGDACMSPTGRLCVVVDIRDGRLLLQYVRSGWLRSSCGVDVQIQAHLCRWLSLREVQALTRPKNGHSNEGGADAAA